ncbi:DUF4031 domain-containing protein, partial [Leucobacter soli]
RPIRRRQYLTAEWAALAERAGVGRSASPTTGAATDAALADKWHRLGGELIGRWNEPHRRYHDERHLEDVLLSLDQLAVRGERIAPAALLAAWFHDAVYAGTGTDETDSARLAVAALAAFDLTPALVRQVGDFIVATAPAAELPSVDPMLAHLLDADLSIFGAGEERYERYTTAVRAEYAHVPEDRFRAGRAEILRGYLAHPAIYRTAAARQLWEDRARANLEREIAALASPTAPLGPLSPDAGSMPESA